MPEDADLIVIGSGQGGSPLALAFASENKRVVLFESGRLGGSCVNYGCTPSKAYLAAAHNAGRARVAGPLGVHADVRVDGRAVMERVRDVRDQWHDSSEKKFADSRVDLIRATAHFTGVRTVAGGGREVRAPLVVIDTGTSPACPPIEGLADTPYFTNLTWFDQITLPRRLAVIGGGYIGLELGQGAQRLGSAVTICTSGEKLMPSEDADAVEIVRKAMEGDGVAFQLDCETTSVQHDGSSFHLTFDNGTSLEADAVLVAAGRKPNTGDLHADRSGVRLDEAGFVAVDDFLQTACPGVYALGDVAREPAFTHVSWEDYRRLRSTLSGTPRKRDDRVLSYATFTEPQLARTGLSEREAKAGGRDVRVQTLPLEDVARGEEWNLTDGFYRLIVDTHSDAILGATLVGYEAGEIVHTLAFAIHLGATRRQLDEFMAIHPTFSEGLPSLARAFE